MKRQTKVISKDCIEVIFKGGKPQKVYSFHYWWHVFLRLAELEEKQEARQFIYPDDDQESYKCPSCNVDLGFTDDYFGDLEITQYCRYCGQALCK